MMAIFILPCIVIIAFSSLFSLSTSLLLYLDMFLSELFWYLSELEVNAFWFQLGELNWQSLILIYLVLFLLLSPFKIVVYLPIFVLLVNKLTEQRSLWQVDILDVGHGLSVLISQNNKAYTYDIGAKYMSGSSIAKTQIIP